MKKYLFDNETYTDETSLEDAIHIYACHNFDEWIDDIYEPVTIMGNLEYPTSRVLKDTDPIAYRCYLSDYEDYLLREVEEVATDE